MEHDAIQYLNLDVSDDPSQEGKKVLVPNRDIFQIEHSS